MNGLVYLVLVYSAIAPAETAMSIKYLDQSLADIRDAFFDFKSVADKPIEKDNAWKKVEEFIKVVEDSGHPIYYGTILASEILNKGDLTQWYKTEDSHGSPSQVKGIAPEIIMTKVKLDEVATEYQNLSDYTLGPFFVEKGGHIFSANKPKRVVTRWQRFTAPGLPADARKTDPLHVFVVISITT